MKMGQVKSDFGASLERRGGPQTHDYGMARVTDGGMRLRIAGWGKGIKAGDYLILPNGNDTTRYRVEDINYRMDPPDMWFADAVFAPRQAVSAA
jgi:hypothetical protein